MQQDNQTIIDKLKPLIGKMQKNRVLCYGDLMLDEFIWGQAERISPEAPVPVVNITGKEFRLGGSANVINNLTSLSLEKTYALGFTGTDDAGHMLTRLLKDKGADTSLLLASRNSITTMKTRIIVHNQQLLRVDNEKHLNLTAEEVSSVNSKFDSVVKDLTSIIISDYDKGCANSEVVSHILQKSLSLGKIVAVDPKPINIELFKGATIITPNNKEAQQITGIKIESDDDALSAASQISSRFKIPNVVITRGAKGMTILTPTHKASIPAIARNVYDVTGAGDTVISVLTQLYTVTNDLVFSAKIATCAAAIVVGEVGTSTVTMEKIINLLANTDPL